MLICIYLDDGDLYDKLFIFLNTMICQVWFLSKLVTVTFLLVWCGSDSLAHVSNFLIQVIQVISTNKHEWRRQQSRSVTSTATHVSRRRQSREDNVDLLIPCTLQSNTNAESSYEKRVYHTNPCHPDIYISILICKESTTLIWRTYHTHSKSYTPWCRT